MPQTLTGTHNQSVKMFSESIGSATPHDILDTNRLHVDWHVPIGKNRHNWHMSITAITKHYMKSNLTLHNRIGFQNPAQLVWYAAHVLLAAITSSPAISIRSGSSAVTGKRAIPGYEGFAGFAAKTAVQNTTGYTAGEVFPGRPEVPAQAAANGYAAVVRIAALAPSPAYGIGVAIPRFVAVAARPEQLESLPVAAISKVDSPKVDAIKGWETAIEITQSAEFLTVVAELPVYGGVGIVGSSKLVVGEITPSTLQAPDFIQPGVSDFGQSDSIALEINGSTLESIFYHNALLCQHTIVDTIRNGINCKTITVTIFTGNDFNSSSDDLQLDKIFVNQVAATLSPLGTIRAAFPDNYSSNLDYPSEQSWTDYVDSTPLGSPERLFVNWVASNYPSGFNFFTFAEADSFYDPEIHQLSGGYMDNWYFYHFVLK